MKKIPQNISKQWDNLSNKIYNVIKVREDRKYIHKYND